ncbi:MAG: hypothetical protein ACI4DY_13370 [Monoglobaceae bacterium]
MSETFKEYINKCIDNCKTQGEYLGTKDGEVLVKKLAEKLDESGGSGSSSGSGGGMSYDVIVKCPDNFQTYEITHGTYADLKAKIDAHEPVHMLLLVDVTDGDATTKFQVPSMCVAMEGNGEISGLIYMHGQPGPVALYILPDGTAEVRV